MKHIEKFYLGTALLVGCISAWCLYRLHINAVKYYPELLNSGHSTLPTFALHGYKWPLWIAFAGIIGLVCSFYAPKTHKWITGYSFVLMTISALALLFTAIGWTMALTPMTRP